MPEVGPHRTSLIFLADPQMAYFSSPVSTGLTVTDKVSIVRPVVSGSIDAEEENYGVFDGETLIARLTLTSPPPADDNCPTPYWSVGLIEVVNRFQGQGIGPGLLDAVFGHRCQPLASDLNQDGGGADLWRRWIRDHPGKIELFGPEGSLGIVVQGRNGYAPDPWKDGRTRLVRRP